MRTSSCNLVEEPILAKYPLMPGKIYSSAYTADVICYYFILLHTSFVSVLVGAIAEFGVGLLSVVIRLPVKIHIEYQSFQGYASFN